MESLSLSAQRLPGVLIVSICGDLDAGNSGQLDSYLRAQRQRVSDHLVFDLTEMTFMDSAGLRVLLNTYTHATQHGASMYLAALQPRPARVIELTQTDRYLQIHATVQEALLAALRSPESAPDNPTGGHASTA